MPELPEVEIIRQGLKKYVVGHAISSVTVLDEKFFSGDTSEIVGAMVVRIQRKGKGLIIDLDNNLSLIAHVKMTGQFVYRSGKYEDLPHKHTRVIFTLSGNSALYYNDVRRFGWIRVVKTSKVEDVPFFKSLGKDPLSELSLGLFQDLLQSSSMPIKIFLMDQKRIAGIGNIYASEALFLAGVDPRRKTTSLRREEARKVYESIREILKKSIALGGASEVNFRNVEGNKGQYQNHAMVYARMGEKCYVCQAIIRKIRQSGRSTFYCTVCQR